MYTPSILSVTKKESEKGYEKRGISMAQIY
jgi:hypothetical protein